MRLLHTRTKELRWFWEGERPRYAILSHTWLSTSGEVSFQEFEAVLKTPNHPSTDSVESKPGYRKIQQFCDAADKLGFDWGWVDTCCIDKASSAELSEAINSMYRWYEQSALCIAYLSDVTAYDTDLKAHNSPFQKSKWFTRGWTLQELIAPPVLLFFSDTWTCLGDRLTLAPLIEDVCGVPSALSFGRKPIDYSIAQRMSWAAMRATTRKEDIAYCLLGLFGITMSLIYGEADKAFQRLQKKIIKQSKDQTIFAWGFCLSDQMAISPFGSPYQMPVLAKSPLLFEGCGDVVPCGAPQERYFADREFEITREGIRNNLRCIYDIPSICGTRVLGILPCKRLNSDELIGIRLCIDDMALPGLRHWMIELALNY
ncbi:heterokaryon incompatibility protein-domain-containing protein [Xylariaceae sp. AK1471]|nr:heterokaryon incompatibility protein-domain-containing protein [Xylariaceae sp. AK1471]